MKQECDSIIIDEKGTEKKMNYAGVNSPQMLYTRKKDVICKAPQEIHQDLLIEDLAGR